MTAPALSDVHGNVLLRIARAAIDEALDGPASPPLPDEGWLFKPGASFVTLRLRADERLRGCIGTLQPDRPLGEDVQRNAVAAAFRDPRFDCLTRNELDGTRVEVTVLSPLEPLEVRTEEETLRELRPGTDGLVLTWGAKRATFIPAMWEQLDDPSDFLRHLKHKAGMPAGFWHPSIKVHRFTALKWEER